MIPRQLEQVLARQAERDRRRRDVVQLSTKAQSAAKRAIFALHRHDHTQATGLLDEVRTHFKAIEQLAKREPSLAHEGVYRASQEEYAEAMLFDAWLQKHALAFPKQLSNDADIVIGGLCDMVGEIARYCVLRVTEGDRSVVMPCFQTASDVVEALLALDLTGYLRTKFDQTKQHLRRIEDIRYDVAIQGKENVTFSA